MTSVSFDGSVAAGPRQPRAEANRARILEVARQAFNEAGPDVSMQDIAQRAGVGIGTIYRNFASKDDLLTHLAEQVASSLSERGEQALLDADPGRGLELLIRAFVTINRDYRTLILAARSTPDSIPAAPQSLHHMRRVTSAVLARAVAGGALRSDVDMIDVAVLGGAIGLMGDGTTDSSDAAELSVRTDRLVEIVLAGLRPPA